MWSIWPDPEQIKVNGKVAAGPAPSPAGRELHKRLGLGLVFGAKLGKTRVRGRAEPSPSLLVQAALPTGWPQGRREG